MKGIPVIMLSNLILIAYEIHICRLFKMNYRRQKICDVLSMIFLGPDLFC